MTIAAIDFGRLYRDHLAAAGRKPKSAEEWDNRADDMSKRPLQSAYTEAFIARMNLDSAQSLLDVGCGPGTICLSVADRLQHVYGLDYSKAMLQLLRDNAAGRGLTNVEALHRAWEDDWSDVPVCDIVVASRSTAVADIATALAKLNAKARQRVYLTHLVGGHFIDPEIIEVVGRELIPQPDYIYLLNILHRMGIHPRLDYIEQGGRFAGLRDFTEFARRVSWSLGELNAEEIARLRAWFDAGLARGDDIGAPMRWAFISWDVQ